MLPVIAGGIIPATVNVSGVGRVLKFQIVVGLVQQTGTALAFEIINNARQSVFFQKILLDLKRKGTHLASAGRAFEQISSFSLDGTEIRRPKTPILPVI